MLHDITTLEELSHAGLIPLYLHIMQSNTGDNEGLEMMPRSGGSLVNKLILYSHAIRLSLALRSSCQTPDGKTFKTTVTAVSSYSNSGRILDT